MDILPSLKSGSSPRESGSSSVTLFLPDQERSERKSSTDKSPGVSDTIAEDSESKASTTTP